VVFDEGHASKTFNQKLNFWTPSFVQYRPFGRPPPLFTDVRIVSLVKTSETREIFCNRDVCGWGRDAPSRIPQLTHKFQCTTVEICPTLMGTPKRQIACVGERPVYGRLPLSAVIHIGSHPPPFDPTEDDMYAGWYLCSRPVGGIIIQICSGGEISILAWDRQ